MNPATAARILMIEDNQHDGELTLRALKKYQLANDIVWIKDGEVAIDYLFGNGSPTGGRMNRDVFIILLDLKLPKVDGLEILRRLKSDESTRMIPVVVLTSSREERDIVESYRLNVNSYIVKPVDFAKFTEAVRQLGLYWLVMNQPAANANLSPSGTI